MKKRMITLFLAAAMAVSLLVMPAEAAGGKFYDVSDSYTATVIETLRLMGVLDGYSDGTFRPDQILNRAQFCKMAAYVMDGSKELSQYEAMTIFPDVKPSHWASGFINMAAKRGVIAGYPDGKFKPEQPVTAVQAVTILLRLLGYKDSEIGGVWPQSYMAVAGTIGLTDATGITGGNNGLTRGQAAKLFMNLLQTEGKGGSTLYALSDTVTLTAVDGGRGTMTAGGKTYDMVKAAAASTLVGTQGRVVLNGSGKALTFLPVIGKSNSISNAAVIVYADGDVSGLSALAGSNTYSIYKNGVQADSSALRKGDVAVYSAATNSILVCDTRVAVYYQDCRPSPAAPTTVTALNHEFPILPTAMDSVAAFKPGEVMTLLLTADGQIAGVARGSADANAAAVVSGSGDIQLLCGGNLVDLDTTAADSQYFGQIVRISSDSRSKVNLSILSTKTSYDLDVTAKTLGGYKLAENVRVYDGGEQVSLSQLNDTLVRGDSITYYRTDWENRVDLIVLNGQVGDVYYGIAKLEITKDDNGNEDYHTLEIDCGETSTGAIKTPFTAKNNSFVKAVLKNAEDGKRYTSVAQLAQLPGISASSWIGKTAVTYGGRTYTVDANVQCYNPNTGRWMSLDEALVYANALNLYAEGQVIRVAEIRS